MKIILSICLSLISTLSLSQTLLVGDVVELKRETNLKQINGKKIKTSEGQKFMIIDHKSTSPYGNTQYSYIIKDFDNNVYKHEFKYNDFTNIHYVFSFDTSSLGKCLILLSDFNAQYYTIMGTDNQRSRENTAAWINGSLTEIASTSKDKKSLRYALRLKAYKDELERIIKENY
ncbi:hypothetical protein [Flammeovirga aprica]|uniref:DUF4468 domain-containing protein n=1 Tax=Flammeovirga aprica JL-4 TaxID=694437 RepID=A0A7X9XD85_9BACT|nr:hypothetical protein [Flammeovirga aprica]NME72535.1 hypothetical protein [Flammeovirga aprica JL-4]